MTPDSNPAELAACPFCNGRGDIYTPTFPMAADCDDIYVCCEQCDAMGPQVLFDNDTHTPDDLDDLIAEAIAAWNRRAPTSAPVDQVGPNALFNAARFLLWQYDRKGPLADSAEAWEALREALASTAPVPTDTAKAIREQLGLKFKHLAPLVAEELATDTADLEAVREAARKRVLSYVFEAAQPNRGDVFSWIDDHIDGIIDAAFKAGGVDDSQTGENS